MFEARIQPNFKSWRSVARTLLQARVEPADILWSDGTGPAALPMLTQPAIAMSQNNYSTMVGSTVPKDFITLAKAVSLHRDFERWPLLYRVLYRLTGGERHLLNIVVDDDVHRLLEMEKSVRRDLHKMHAFVRFRRVDREDGEQYVAFHRPDHLILPAAAPWFARRFAAMRWTILTPDSSASWDGEALVFGPGAPASSVSDDGLEELWRTYYANIFNPARIKIRAMKKELPVRHWKTLPEAQIIDELLCDAPARVEEMMRRNPGAKNAEGKATATSAAEFVPESRALPVLREAASGCKGCDLYCHATQTVFGEGPARAVAMFVGEQPGDQEDLAGHPFVGPAGKILDQALEEVGIDRSACYVTNAVKHFKFEPRGKRRIHAKPGAREINACKPWLQAEVEAIKPPMIIALGATAAQAMMGPQFRVTQSRGQVFADTQWAPWFMATIHPSALLRIPDPKMREESHKQFLAELKTVAEQILATHRTAGRK